MQETRDRSGELSPVVELRLHRTSVPLVRPFITAVRRADTADLVFVEAVDEDGRSGWGEAAISWRVTGESPESVAAVVSGPIRAAVLGHAPRDLLEQAATAKAVWGNAAARSAVDWALADLDAGQHGQPLADALASGGGTPSGTRSVRTDMTLSADQPSAVAVAAAGHVSAGFTTLKVKAQAGIDIRAVLSAVRHEVGDAIVLRVDANQAWSVDEAITAIRACEDAGLVLQFVEQPVTADDIDGMAAVRAAVDTPILADESARTALDVRRLALAGAADLVNIKLAKTGGVAETLRTVAAARTAGLGILIGCMLEGPVGVGAAAALAAVVAPGEVHDLDGGLWLRDAVVDGGARYVVDRIELADAPGLGIRRLHGVVA